jgi:nicotinate-nucleotide adenylyltransferase
VAESNPKHSRRLGIFGGGFDPVHRGHLLLASELKQLARIDHLLVIPTHRPPHKPTGFVASFEDRFEMTRIAFEHFVNCTVTNIEQTLAGPGYSLDLVMQIKKAYSADEFCLCLGADQYRDLPQWHEPAQLAREVTFCVGQRPGECAEEVKLPFEATVKIYNTSLLDISASRIRALVKQGVSESELATLVPNSVAQYIFAHGLYR